MFKKPKRTTLPGMNQERLGQEAEALSGSRSRKKWKSDPFCAGATPERIHVLRNPCWFCSSPSRWESVLLTEICWPDTAPWGPADRGASVLPPCGDRFLSKTLCQNRTDISGLYLSKMRSISIRLEGTPPWMAGLDSPDNSRCQETTVPVGTRLFSQLATSSQVRDETTNGLCGGLGNIYCPERKCFLETRQLQLYKGTRGRRPCLWGLCIFCLILSQRILKNTCSLSHILRFAS